jgi:sulfite exporter TauE/SafE
MTSAPLLFTAFLFGLAGGFHCLAMCGGFVGALAARDNVQPLLPARTLAWRLAAHHAGRLTTYALLGALMGASGGALLGSAWLLPLQRTLYILANLLILGLAFALAGPLLGISAPLRAGQALYRHILARVPAAAALPGWRGRYAVGLLWGLVPCASIYAMLPVALFAGNAMAGAAAMLAFGLGTVPHLAGASALLRWKPQFTRHPAWRMAGAAALAAISCAGLWHAAFAAGDLMRGVFCIVP